MSVPHEPSYYEIALTNRQVLTVFVVLLVCVVAAFFSGVWIGRRGPIEIAEAEVAQAEKSPAAAEARSVKELHFFSDEPQQPRRRPPEEVPQETGRGATVLENLTGEESTASTTASPPPEPQEAEPVPVQKAVQSRSPAPAVVADKPARPPLEASGRQLPAASPPAGEGAGDLVIQVLFSADEERARSLVERLGGGGYPAFLTPVEVGEQIMYRVRLGPYRERSEAEAVADRVRRAFKLDTWITH